MNCPIPSIPLREVLRYALGANPPDPVPEELLSRARQAIQLLEKTASPAPTLLSIPLLRCWTTF